MNRNTFCTRPALTPSDGIAGDEACPRLFADDGNAQPPSSGRADARQPGETASLLPRIISANPEKSICPERLAKFRVSATEAAVVSHYILNMDLHLWQIAHSRACRDFGVVVREALAVVCIGEYLGALHVRTAAQELERACHAGDYAATYGLLSALSQACDEAATELNEWLDLNRAQRGS